MSPLQLSANSKASAGLSQSMNGQWRLFLTEGIVLSMLGLAAIFFVPTIAGRSVAVFLGWVFLISGLMGLVSTFCARKVPGFEWSLLSALMAVIAGTVLLWNPIQSVTALPEHLLTLTYVLIAFFMVDGILIISLALTHRREPSGKWEWMMVNGLIDLILAGIIISGLPGTLVWVLGLLVGIDMVVGGASLIAMALEARKTAFTQRTKVKKSGLSQRPR